MVKYNAGLILNHMRGTPDSWAKLGSAPDVMGTVVRKFSPPTVHRARLAGVDTARLVIDPGLGFGKAQGAEFRD